MDSEDPLTLDERVNLSKDADHRHVLSIAQDIIHVVTHSRIKTPKHIALPIAVKQMTGSAQTVTLLNRFGNALSVSQISEIEAGMAENMLQQEQQVFIPSSICKDSLCISVGTTMT